MKALCIFIMTILQVCSVFAQNSDADWLLYCCQVNPKDSITQKRLDADVEVIESIKQLELDSLKIWKVINLFKNERGVLSLERNNLNFDLKSYAFKVYGGYHLFSIKALTCDEYVLKFTFSFEPLCHVLHEYPSETITADFNCVNRSVQYRRINRLMVSAYQKTYPDFQLESSDSIPQKEQDIYYFFADYVNGEYVLSGELHTSDNFIPEAFDNIRYLILNKKYDTLERILFSENPIGQIFAVAALQYVSDSFGYFKTPKINERIDQITQHKTIIRTGQLNCWENRFNYDQYDIINDFDTLLNQY